MRRIGVMATTLCDFAGEDAKLLDPRRVFKPSLAGFWAEQDVPERSFRIGRYSLRIVVVSSHTATVSSASWGATMRAPIARTLASLWVRDRRAVNRSLHNAARIPRTLLAAICSPCPDPPMMMPRSTSPDATILATFAETAG